MAALALGVGGRTVDDEDVMDSSASVGDGDRDGSGSSVSV